MAVNPDLARFAKGAVVQRYHDSGAFGMTLVFGEVVRVNRVTVTVRWEWGNVTRSQPHQIEPVSPNFSADIRAEYLSKLPGGNHD